MRAALATAWEKTIIEVAASASGVFFPFVGGFPSSPCNSAVAQGQAVGWRPRTRTGFVAAELQRDRGAVGAASGTASMSGLSELSAKPGSRTLSILSPPHLGFRVGDGGSYLLPRLPRCRVDRRRRCTRSSAPTLWFKLKWSYRNQRNCTEPVTGSWGWLGDRLLSYTGAPVTKWPRPRRNLRRLL